MSIRKDYYVYALLKENGVTPFYVGKGTRGRINQHVSEARSGATGRKADEVRRVMSQIGRLPTIKLAVDLTESEAFDLEAMFILHFGRVDLGDGPLLNYSDGGEGCSGHVIPAVVRAKMSASASTPEEIQRRRAVAERLKLDGEWQRKLSAAQQRVRADPATSAYLLAVMQEAFSKPGVQERRIASVKRSLQRPDVRAKLRHGHLVHQQRDPEGYRKMKSAAAVQRHQRERMRKALLLFTIAAV